MAVLRLPALPVAGVELSPRIPVKQGLALLELLPVELACRKWAAQDLSPGVARGAPGPSPRCARQRGQHHNDLCVSAVARALRSAWVADANSATLGRWASASETCADPAICRNSSLRCDNASAAESINASRSTIAATRTHSALRAALTPSEHGCFGGPAECRNEHRLESCGGQVGLALGAASSAAWVCHLVLSPARLGRRFQFRCADCLT